MRVFFTKRNKGISLIELAVATAIFSIISLAAFKVLAEGLRYVRVNELAIDAQRAGLSILSGIGSGIQNTRSDLLDSSPSGLVFASPINPDGQVEFDLTEQEVLWQKWVCFYYNGTTITLRETPMAPTINPGTPPTAASFSGEKVRKVLTEEATVFQVSQKSAVPPIWSVELTIGSLDDRELYGMELNSEVGPRN